MCGIWATLIGSKLFFLFKLLFSLTGFLLKSFEHPSLYLNVLMHMCVYIWGFFLTILAWLSKEAWIKLSYSLSSCLCTCLTVPIWWIWAPLPNKTRLDPLLKKMMKLIPLNFKETIGRGMGQERDTDSFPYCSWSISSMYFLSWWMTSQHTHSLLPVTTHAASSPAR